MQLQSNSARGCWRNMLTVDSSCLHKMSQVHSKLPGDDALVIGTENRITWLKIGTERRCPLCKSVQFFKLPLGMTTREHKWLTRCYLLKSIEYLLHVLTCCQVTTCQCYSWIDGRTIPCWKLIPRSLRGKLLECFPFFSRNQRFDIPGHATTLIYLDIFWYILICSIPVLKRCPPGCRLPCAARPGGEPPSVVRWDRSAEAKLISAIDPLDAKGCGQEELNVESGADDGWWSRKMMKYETREEHGRMMSDARI